LFFFHAFSIPVPNPNPTSKKPNPKSSPSPYPNPNPNPKPNHNPNPNHYLINRNHKLWGMRHWLPALCAACESLFDGLPSGKPFCRRLGTA
jgi:hypothetical protein